MIGSGCLLGAARVRTWIDERGGLCVCTGAGWGDLRSSGRSLSIHLIDLLLETDLQVEPLQLERICDQAGLWSPTHRIQMQLLRNLKGDQSLLTSN